MPGDHLQVGRQEPNRPEVQAGPLRLQQMHEEGLLQKEEALLQLQKRRSRRGGEEEEAEVGPPADRGADEEPRRPRLPQDQTRPIRPPRLRDRPRRREDMLGEGPKAGHRRRAPIRQGPRAEALRPLQEAAGGEAQWPSPDGLRRQEAPGQDVQGLPRLRRRPPGLLGLPARLGGRQGRGQEGDTHRHLAGVELPDRDPHRQGEPGLGQEGDNQDPESRRARLPEHPIPDGGPPIRQRDGVPRLLDGGGADEEGRGRVQDVLRQADEVRRQGRGREEPRAGPIRVPQGQEPRRADPGGPRRGLLQHQLLRQALEGRQNPLRAGRGQVRKGVLRGPQHPEDRQKEGQIAAGDLT